MSKYCEEFIEKYGVKRISRVGLRYINEIDVPSVKKILDWDKYINSNLITYSGFLKENQKTVTRMLNQIEMKTDDYNVIFKYGIWNDKYPSPITNSPFILDIDGFTRLAIDYNKGELERVAIELNKEIESVFELSITASLRREMDK